ncbi:MAG: hypothetical protein OXG37_03075 [Actinomycetia bacterium]|nr:hypothetical protein [Actinomycetes bacterium]
MESTSARLDVALNCRESISHEIASNWKVLCENNFECYHCPANHPTLAAIQDVGEDFSCEFCDRYFRYGPRPDTVHSIQNRDSLLYFLWPNLFIFFIPGVSGVVRQIQPVSSDRSLDVRRYCFSDAVDDDVKPETVEFWKHVLAQDAALCENVQRGLGSGRFGQGRLLLPVTDPAIQRFECMLHRSLSDGD